jgi:thiamine transport system substrate-binding protein
VKLSHPARAVTIAAALFLAACGGDDEATRSAATSAPEPATTARPAKVTLVAYESFPETDTSLNEALAAFTEETGIAVDLVIAGDTGTMVSKAVLTAGNPEGDVMFGVDNTFLSRVIDESVFEPYTADGLDAIPEWLRALVPNGEATPVDFGDVCVNYDIGWFADHHLDPPTSLADLADPKYRKLLVVENPATSSPGLAFLMASIVEFGENGWKDYWAQLRSNGVEVVDGWQQAYYERFSWAGGGPKPLVVSYGTSPPAEVLFADPPVNEAPTAVVESTCFRQVEFAGVLRGTDAPDEAERLVDFLISPRFQSEVALNLFVYPANGDVALPPEFTEYSVQPAHPATLDPATIAANRESWIDQWTDLVLR